MPTTPPPPKHPSIHPPSSYVPNPTKLDTIPSESSTNLTPTTPNNVERTRKTSAKRKASEIEHNTPPKDAAIDHPKQASAGRKTRFDMNHARPIRVSHTSSSSTSHAPSSYHSHKRARLSVLPDGEHFEGPSQDSGRSSSSEKGKASRRPSTSQHHARPSSPSSPPSTRPSSRFHSTRHARPRSPSISGASIPISALISPHAPSVAASNGFHMHDPRKPPPIQPTSWALEIPTSMSGSWSHKGGSPPQAFIFFLGFVLFPIWVLGGWVVKVPRTRRIGGGTVADISSKHLEQGGVLLDDPQVEHDAKTWRRRCRYMAVISLFTYIPFIVLVAVFASRG